jgi:hypothetical protein
LGELNPRASTSISGSQLFVEESRLGLPTFQAHTLQNQERGTWNAVCGCRTRKTQGETRGLWSRERERALGAIPALECEPSKLKPGKLKPKLRNSETELGTQELRKREGSNQ